MEAVHFIGLEEIIDVSDEQLQEAEEDEQDINYREEIRRRLHQAEASNRTTRKLHEHELEEEEGILRLISEVTAENKYLTSKLKELQQQVENIRWERQLQIEAEDEETLCQEQGESAVKSQTICIRKMEKEIQKLREKNADLTAQLEQLSLGEKYQEEIQNLRTAEQELKHKLEEVQEVLRSKDEEIVRKSITLIQENNELEEYFNSIEDLRQDQRELRQQLSSRQEDHMLATQNFHKSTTNEKECMFSRCAKSPWKGLKVAGAVALSVLLPVGIVASMVPVCNNPDPDCNLWNIAFDLLEPYSELYHMLPPVY